MQVKAPPPHGDRPRHRRFRAAVTIGSVLAIAAAVAAFALVASAGQEEEQAAGPGAAPLSVATGTVRWQDGYVKTRAFVGRVEARRESDLGFELPGMIAAVHADEGDAVAAGQVVAELDTERLRARREELAAARDEALARLELARLRFERTAEARERNATSRQEFDDAEKSLAAAEAALQRADAAVRSVAVDIGKATLRSPFDAVIAQRHADPGRVVDPGTPVLRVLEFDRPQARIGVAGSSIDAIEAGDRVTVIADGREIPGEVAAILPTRDPAGRAVDAIIDLEVRLGEVRRGDLARLAVDRPVSIRGFWVPLRALTEGTRGLWTLYTLHDGEGTDESARVLETPVELLNVEADRAYVRGAADEGQRYVRDGLHRVTPGMRVRPEAAPEGPVPGGIGTDGGADP